MSKRLQVILNEDEYEEIRATAQRQRMTVSQWVRQSLREARAGGPRRTAEEKLEVLRRAVESEFPTGDIEEMLDDIERGRLGRQPS